MTRFNFIYKKKKFYVNIRKCENFFSKMSGLMFRKKSLSLLFIFNKPVSEAIHSFFCVKFIGIWFNGDKIVDVKYVKPWKFYVVPEKKFDKLLEIPENDDNFYKILNLIKET